MLSEARGREPLMPLSIFRIRGLAAADATQLIAFAGFYSMFSFLTLYMREVLHWSPIQAGAAYLPVTAGLAFAATMSPKLFARVGTRPVLVGGSLCPERGLFRRPTAETIDRRVVAPGRPARRRPPVGCRRFSR